MEAAMICDEMLGHSNYPRKKSFNNRCALRQRHIARRFQVNFTQSSKTNIDCYKKPFKMK